MLLHLATKFAAAAAAQPVAVTTVAQVVAVDEPAQVLLRVEDISYKDELLLVINCSKLNLQNKQAAKSANCQNKTCKIAS